MADDALAGVYAAVLIGCHSLALDIILSVKMEPERLKEIIER